jgi:bacterial/archaeal transporter family-2 protein
VRLILMLAVFIVGVLQPVQAGFNATSARALGSRFQAGWINGAINVVLITTVLLVLQMFGGRDSGGGLPSPSGVRGVPWWALFGGAIGACVVLVQLTAAPKLGAALLIAIFVAGTAFGSLLCDRFGLAGYEKAEVHYERWLGMALVVAGVVMVARPWARS